MPYIAGGNRAIDTGDTYFNEISKSTVSGSVDAKRKIERDRLKSNGIASTQPLNARIEYARWVVDCPNCNSAEFAFEDGLFYCSLCKNSDMQGKPRRVKMPNERKQIEVILGKRPIINRHWNSGETVTKLEEENNKRGV